MFALQIVVSFIVGGLVLALQSMIAERVPVRWRGAILGLPTTIAVALFFIGWTKTPADVVDAIRIVPVGVAVDYLFVLCFAFFSRHTLVTGFFGAFVIWTLGGIVAFGFPAENLGQSVLLYAFPVITGSYLLIRRLPQVSKLTPVPFTRKHVAVRSLIGGTIIATTTVLAKTLGNMWGGLFSVFPAAFSSTFLIYSFVHGTKIIPSVAKSMFFPGAPGFILYAIAAAWAFPLWGIWIGTLVAYLITIPFYVLFVLIRAKVVSVRAEA